jgi:glycosyltransferase involved in cell wall biosynthesis
MRGGSEVKIAWVNQHATLVGGAERYVSATAASLDRQGVRSSLLYDVTSRVSAELCRPFEATLPLVDVASQLRGLSPDVVYVHQLTSESVLDDILSAGFPVVRFLHDHRLLCLREHKYTAIGQEPCTQSVGLRCYSCLGFTRRDRVTRRLEIYGLGALRADIARHDRVDRIVVGSHYMRDQAVGAGFREAAIEVVPLATPEPTTSSLPGAAEREEGLVLHVGALTKGKGVDTAIAALARTSGETHLVLVGDGPQRAELLAQAKDLGVGHRVTFAGHLAPAEVSALYRRASCLVMPARQPESFGLVGLEAMSHGVPVIASRLGGTAEWLDHGRTGFFIPPNDPASLAQAMTTLVEDPSLATRLGVEGQRAHRARFLPERHASRLLTILGETARNRRAA